MIRKKNVQNCCFTPHTTNFYFLISELLVHEALLEITYSSLFTIFNRMKLTKIILKIYFYFVSVGSLIFCYLCGTLVNTVQTVEKWKDKNT
jgi:hypothetical protein